MNGRNRGKNENMLEEADIGSGEKTPGQEDTDKIIEQIGEGRPPQPDKDNRADKARRKEARNSEISRA